MAVLLRGLGALMMAVTLVMASGCSSKKTIDATSAEAVIAGVNKGDNVRITTRNDAVHTFTVTKITNKALYGNSARVVYEDMAKVEIRGKSDDAEPAEEEGGFWSKLF